MSRPLIGITCGLRHGANGSLFYGSSPAYVRSVEQAGGLPIVIPPTPDEQTLRQIYERLDGVLLSGGGDIDPAYYHTVSDGLIYEIDLDRDVTEVNVTKWAAADDKPLFGICRGCQVVNVALGGTLYRDIRAEYPGGNDTDHDLGGGKFPRNHLAHSVTVVPGSHLEAVIRDLHPSVNSMHHQAVRDVPPDLTVSANSPDGLIEAVEILQARFFLAVQWHPEELTEHNTQGEAMRRLFENFIEAACR